MADITRPALFIFAKQPVAGQVKTRLVPDYTPAQAAGIAAFLIRTTVANAVAHWRGEVYLCGAPDAEHPLFEEMAQRHGVKLRAQAAGDLGAKMHAALCFGIEHHGAAAVLGCDAPQCPGDTLTRAETLLIERKNALGPAEDGGYYLIGLSQPHAGLFEQVRWGSSEVLPTTLERAQSLGISLELLPPLIDIDTAADITAVAEKFAPLQEYLRVAKGKTPLLPR